MLSILTLRYHSGNLATQAIDIASLLVLYRSARNHLFKQGAYTEFDGYIEQRRNTDKQTRETQAVETWITIGTVLGGFGALVAAGAAIFAAIFTYRLMKSGQKQVEIGEHQIYAQQQPVLVPTGTPTFQADHTNWLKWDENEQPLGLRNVGTGTAFNVASALYGCLSYVIMNGSTYGRDTNSADTHWTCWLGVPIVADETVEATHLLGNGVFLGVHRFIHMYPLHAPHEPVPSELMMSEAVWVVARLTTTYHDIFGRKHASIFEWVNNRGWQRLATVSDIARDLHDQEGMTTERKPRTEEEPGERPAKDESPWG